MMDNEAQKLLEKANAIKEELIRQENLRRDAAYAAKVLFMVFIIGVLVGTLLMAAII